MKISNHRDLIWKYYTNHTDLLYSQAQPSLRFGSETDQPIKMVLKLHERNFLAVNRFYNDLLFVGPRLGDNGLFSKYSIANHKNLRGYIVQENPSFEPNFTDGAYFWREKQPTWHWNTVRLGHQMNTSVTETQANPKRWSMLYSWEAALMQIGHVGVEVGGCKRGAEGG